MRRTDCGGTGGLVTHGNHPGVLLVPEPLPARGAHTGMTLGEVLQRLGPARNTVAGTLGSALEFADGTLVLVSADGVVVYVSR